MNTKPSVRLINDGNHANSEYLAALMTWPNDFSRGNLLIEASIRNLSDRECNPQSASIFKDKNKEIQKALWPGFVVGKIFFNTLRGLSLGKSQYLALHKMNRSEFNGKLKTLSIESVRNYWRAYKCVAHLWAAYAMFVENQQKPETNLLVQYAEKLREMSVAQGGIKGCNLFIIDTDIGPFDGQITITPILDDELEILEDYEPH